MQWLSLVGLLQRIVGLGLFNVWLVRRRASTSYRGGIAKTLQEEFATYGLAGFAFYLVGALKVGAALVLIAGVLMALPVRRLRVWWPCACLAPLPCTSRSATRW